MGIDGKAKLTVIHHIGAATEGTGTVTGNEDLKRDGQHEQARPKLSEARDRVKERRRHRGHQAPLKVKDGFAKE